MCSVSLRTFLLKPHHPMDQPQGEETTPMLCCSLLLCRTALTSTVSISFPFYLWEEERMGLFYSLSRQCSCMLYQSARLCLFVFRSVAFNFLISRCSSATGWWLVCAALWSAPSRVEVTLLYRGLSLNTCLQIHWPLTIRRKILLVIGYRWEMGKLMCSERWLHFQTGNCLETLFYDLLRSNRYQWGFWGE